MRKPNYDKFPFTNVAGKDEEVFSGYETIISELKKNIDEKNNKKLIVAVECYHGILEEEVLTALIKGLSPTLTINLQMQIMAMIMSIK